MLNFRSKHFQINGVIEEEGYICNLFGLKWVLGATYLNTTNHYYGYYHLCDSHVQAPALPLTSPGNL